MGREGLEQPANLRGESAIGTGSAAYSHALDADLKRIVTAWPALPASVRANMLALLGDG